MASSPLTMRDFLAAGGKLGADLLAVDWSATPLGDPDDWPLSLRSAVRILVTSKFSMWLAWGPELTFFCNDAYRRDTLGKKYPWALGRPASLVWSEIWDEVSPRIEAVMATGEATWDEALQLFLERSGYVEETYHTFSYSPLADDDGSVSGMLCVVAEVTEQVVADRRMRTLRDLGVGISAASTEHQAVRAACDHLASNPASLPFVAVYLFEDDGRSARLAGHTGFGEAHAALPTLLSAEDDVWPLAAGWSGEATMVHDLSALSDRFGELPTGAWTEPPHTAFVTPILQPSEDHPYGVLVVGLNRYRPFDASYRDFVDLVAGHLSGAITDARAIEFQRQRAETLASLDQAKTDFLANVSHELRTPLTLLLGPAEDALTDLDEELAPSQRRRLEVITRNAQRMLQLVNSLLDYAKLEAGDDDGLFVETDVGRYTAELASMFESAASRVGLELAIDCASVIAHLDRDHWSKIVVNLVSNAMKFTLEGSVTIMLRQHDGHAVLTVSDSGTGIAEHELPRLFDRFHRVAGARSRTHEGSGIGLALVAELVAAHGGTVDVSSTVDVGTTFTVRLPLGTAHLPHERVTASPGLDTAGLLDRHQARVATHVATWATARDESTDDPHPSDIDEDFEGDTEGDLDGASLGRILVVDDNFDMRAYVAHLLRQEGYAVDLATDGIAALDHMESRLPDLVLTDVMMPRLDGFGLVARMQADPRLTVVPVIMLSARAGEEGTLQALDAGVDDYLVKPFSARELLARVRVNLALDRAARVRDVLERSKALMDQAQRLAAIGSWEIDLESDTITASDQFLSMIETSADELRRRGTTGVIRDVVHPDDVERVLGILQAARPGDRLTYETRVVLPSGTERLFAVRADVPAQPESVSRIIRGSFQDITDERGLQERLIAAEAEQEVAARERAIAEALQQALLPSRAVDVEGIEVATHYSAGVEGTQVGGDWYDVIDLGAGRVMLIMGDVMGRGITAAAVTGQLRAAARAFAMMDLAPAELLEQLDTLVQDLGHDEIVTCVVVIVDRRDLTLSFANAGHPPVLVDGPSGASRLRATGPPLGAGFFGVGSETLHAKPGDTLLLYTDGLVERRGRDLFADIDQLAAMVRSTVDRPVAEQAQAIVTHFGDVERGGANDDVALLLARLHEPPPGTTSTTVLDHDTTAPARARQVVADHLVRCGAPGRVISDVELAVSELVTNAVLHARPPVVLDISCQDGRVELEVSDRTLLRPHRQRPDEDDEHGRGINIVEALSTSWGTRQHDGGKSVWCTFTWS